MKSRIPYILLLILIIPFFMAASVFTRAEGKGPSVMNTFYSMETVKENGEVSPSEMPFDFEIKKSGNYMIDYSWSIDEPDYLTCFAVTDEDGNCVYSDSALQVTGNSKVYLKKGKYKAVFIFAGNEKEFLDFNEKTPVISDKDRLTEYLDIIGFDEFPEDGKRTAEFSLDIKQSASFPVWLAILSFTAGIIALGLIVLIIVSDKNTDSDVKERTENLSIRYALFMLAVTLIQVITSYFVTNLPIELSPKAEASLALLLIVLSVDIAGFPLIWFLLKKIPATPVKKQKISAGEYILYMLMTVGIVISGAIVGVIVHMAITLPFGGLPNELAEIIQNAPVPLTVLVVGILAPIFEELIFRKLLIDRLNKYGVLISVLVSGLSFGLFHGNFQQFFFATMLGCLFAQLYLKTGRVSLTIGLHMFINLGSSVITNSLLRGVYKTNPNMVMTPEFLTANPDAMASMMLYVLWLALGFLVSIIGTIVLIVFIAKKKFRIKAPKTETPAAAAVKSFFTGRYSIIMFLICAGLFIFSYLPVIMGI